MSPWNKRWLKADAFPDFALTPAGAIREARMEAISPLTDFSFDFRDLRLAPLKKSPRQERRDSRT